MSLSEKETLHDTENGEPSIDEDTVVTPVDAPPSYQASEETKASSGTSSIASKLMLVFGPSGSYFFTTGLAWSYQPSIRNQDDVNEWKSWKINNPYCVALATDYGWYAAYKSVDSPPTWKLKRPERRQPTFGTSRKQWQRNHEENIALRDWLSKHIITEQDFQQCRVSFGPGSTYYAKLGRSVKWYDLPASLEEEIARESEHEPSNNPSHVAFGTHGTWVALWPNGTCTWRLGKDYVDLQSKLTAKNREEISYIAIDPSSTTTYFMVFKTGTWLSLLDKTCSDAINLSMTEYTQNLSREKNIPFQTVSTHRPSELILPDPASQQGNELARLRQEVQELKAQVAIQEKKTSDAKTLVVGVGVIVLLGGCSIM